MSKKNGKSKKSQKPYSQKRDEKHGKSDIYSLCALVVSVISLIHTIFYPLITNYLYDIEDISVIGTAWNTADKLIYSYNDGIGDNANKIPSYVEGFLFSATLENSSSRSVVISDFAYKRINAPDMYFERLTILDPYFYREEYGDFPVSIEANDCHEITFVIRYFIPDEVDELLFKKYGYYAEVDSYSLITYLADNCIDLFGNCVEYYIWTGNRFRVDEYARPPFLPEYNFTFWSSKGTQIDTVFNFKFN